LLGRLGTYWEIPSEASSATQSIGAWRWTFSFSKDHMPRRSPVPSCRDGLGRDSYSSRFLGASSRLAGTNDGARCLANGAGHLSFPASQLPGVTANRALPQGGGVLPPAFASQTVSHVGARVPYRDEGSTPADHEGRQPAFVCFGVQPLFPCKTGHASSQFS